MQKLLVAATVSLINATALLPRPLWAQQRAYALERNESAQTLANKAMELLNQGEDAVTVEAKRSAYEQGLRLAKQAVSLDERNADAHFALFANNGRLMLLDGVSANPITLLKASSELDRALELNPQHTNALAAKGGMYRQLPWVLGGSLSRAEGYLLRAIELDPNAVGARIELARTYCDMGTPDRAVPLLRKAQQLAEQMGKHRQIRQARELLSQLGH